MFHSTFTNVSIHGLRTTAVATTKYACWWILTFFVSLSIICYQLISLANILQTNPRNLDITIRSETNVFPAVTSCNTGTYRKSMVTYIPTFVNMETALSEFASTSIRKRQVTKQEITNSDVIGEKMVFKRQVAVACDNCIFYNSVCMRWNVTWDASYADRQSMCKLLGGDLPVFNSVQEFNDICSLKKAWGDTEQWYTRYIMPLTQINATTWRDTNGLLLPVGLPLDYHAGSGCLAIFDQTYFYAALDCSWNHRYDYINDVTGCVCPTKCPILAIPPNTIAFNLSVELNAVVKFACPPGWNMTGSSNITCVGTNLGNIRWSADPPICTPSTCPIISLPKGLTALYSGQSISDWVSFTCPDGVDLLGPTNISCIPNGNTAVWSAPPPICTIVLPIQNFSTSEFLEMLNFPERPDSIGAADQLDNMMEFLLSTISDTDAQRIGFRQTDLILSCLFNGFPCEYQLNPFQYIRVPELLSCYTFNHKNRSTFLMSQRPGEYYGLVMLFDVQLDEYISTRLVPGVQIFIQEQFDPILPGAMGIVLSPGLDYHISLIKQVENKLSVQNRPCLTNVSKNYYNAYPNYTNFAEGCLRSYLQFKTIEKCGCGSPKYPIPRYATYCNITNGTEKQRAGYRIYTQKQFSAKCVTEFLDSSGNSLTEQSQLYCPSACRTVSFKIVSTFLKHVSHVVSCRKNVASLKLYYQTDTTVVFTETLKYGVTDVLASIGGSIGCFAGMSVISTFELMLVVIRLILVLKRNGENS